LFFPTFACFREGLLPLSSIHKPDKSGIHLPLTDASLLSSPPLSQVSTEVTGTLSEALVGFRQQVMEHLTTHMSGAVEEVDAFGDDEEVEVCEEDSVDEFIKGKKKQKK
jgi:hypothetical protein